MRQTCRPSMPLLPLLLAMATPAGSAWADDIDASAPVSRVTVFPRGAEVTRQATVALQPGEHRLVVSGLPAGIDPARLQVRLDDPDIRLGSMALEQIHEGALVSPQEQQLQAELDVLLERQREITDEIASAQTQLTLLDSLASSRSDQAFPAVADLAATLEVLATSGNAARSVIRDAERRLRTLEEEIGQKRFELSQVATQARTQQTLSISVASDSAVSTSLAVTYPSADASWQWLYEARLDTETGYLQLNRQASVTQSSGEDWSEVALTVSTGRSDQSTEAPDPGSLLVDIYDPDQANRGVRMSAAPVAADSVEQVVVTGSFLNSEAVVAASRYLVDYEIPGQVSIAADSQPQILPIDQRGMPVELAIRAVPEMDASAYLEAVFVLEDDVPIQAGTMQLYRDGAFIGSRRVDSFLPREEVRLAFGKDERIRIVAQPDAESSRDGGIIRRNRVEDHRMRYTITSYHPQPVALEVLARVPVPGNDAISVEVPRDATAFSETDVDGDSGVNLWRVTANPGEPLELKHYYSVSYPQDMRLRYR